MAPKKPVLCAICRTQESKYSCPTCYIVYCSVKCFKEHKENICAVNAPTQIASSLTREESDTVVPERTPPKRQAEEQLADKIPLKPLTSLKWPYIPDAPSYDDPLKRDEPKPLKLRDYEAIASSPAIRKTLMYRPNLRSLLQRVDKLRGTDREVALERLLGVSTATTMGFTDTEEDIEAMKELAEAIENCVRRDKVGALGLDWDEHT